MKHNMKRVLSIVALLMLTLGTWAGQVIIVKKPTTGGTVTASEATAGQICTLTVKPNSGYYLESLTAVTTLDGGSLQAPMRRTGINVAGEELEITSDATADPSGETTHTFTMPTEGSLNVEVTVNFHSIVTYNLYIGETQVTELNADKILGDSKVSFTPASTDNGNVNTLTLNGATLTVPVKIGLSDLTIDIQGTNTITTSETCIQKMDDTNPRVTFKSTSTEVGSLSLKGTSGVYGVGYGTFSISDQFAVILKKDGYYYSNQYELTNGSTKEALLAPSYGLTVGGMQIYEGNATDVIGDGIGDGDDSGMVSFDKATSTLTLENASISGIIRSSLPNLIIELDGNSSIYSVGDRILQAGSAVNMTIQSTAKNGSLSMHKSYSSTEKGNFVDDNVNLIIATPLSILSGSLTSDAEENDYYATIGMTYGLTVGGVQVTSLNASGIEGDGITEGTVTFTPDDGTNGNILTLDGANLASNIESGLDNLTILLKGNNNILVDPTSNGQGIKSTNENATLKFAKGGDGCKLTISANTGVVSGFSNSSSPTMGEGLCWFPKLNENSVVEEAVVMDSPFAGGAGTSDSPFLIATYDQLKSFAGLVTDGTLTTQYVKLNANIDCSGKTDFEPIGTYTNPFKGTFHGNEKTISNLTMTNVNNDVVGFFTYNKGTITNLTLSGCTISGGSGSSNYIGMLVGENNGSVSGCTVKNSNVSCNADSQIPSVGGVAGITSKTITNCVVENTNVNAVTSDGGASGAVARAGGIAAYQTDGTVSGCVVKGTTTVASDYSNLSTLVYAGAIIGETGGTVSGNTYESTVTTKTKIQGASDYTVKSGQTQRGFGNGDDVLEKVQLYGVKTVTVYVPDAIGNDECEPVEGTYYMFNYPKIYVLPGSTFTYSMTPSNGYKPVFTLSDNTIAVTTEEKTNAESGSYDHTEFSFTMPETDLTATLSFAIDLASTNYTATIADVAYTSEAVVLGTVSLSYNDDEITPFTKDTHYTIEGYKDSKSEALDAAPVNVGTYHVTIKGVEAQGYTGTKDVQFNITQAENSLTTTPAAVAELAYTGEAQELVTAGVAKFGDVLYRLGAEGTYSATIPTATDANTTGYTVYYKVEGTDNYAGIAEASIVVTIAKATPIITFAQESYSATLGETFTSPVTVDNWTVSPTASSNTSVATISEGQITLVGVGTTTITVTYAGDANYNSTTASYQLVVSRALDIEFVGSNLWASYYDTENLTVPTGLMAYVVSAVNKETGAVTVASVDYIPANNAVLLKRASDGAASGYTAAAYTGTTATVSNLLGGSVNTTAISSLGSDPVYVLFNDKFKRATSGTIPARRAYLVLGAAVAPAGAPQYLTISIIDGNTTAIDTLTVDDSNDSWYTIDGLKLNGKPQRKGLYIKNGKKVYINSNK